VEAEHGVLPREDPEAALIIESSLKRDGVKLCCCGRNLKLVPEGERIRLSVNAHDVQYDELVDQLLVSVGRKPNVENMGLEAAGVKFDVKTGVEIDDKLRTMNKHIFAAGDACSKYQFTHAADFMARIVVQNALFLGRKRLSALTIPWCTYTDPELAHVGLNARDAEAQGLAIDTFVQPLAEVDRAILDGETVGFVKVHVRKGTDAIVGATIVARHAGDMLSGITLAMTAGKGLAALGATIHPYPTQADAVRRVADQWSRTRLTPGVKRWLTRWLAWTR
jgi:pyruvate/2-oxoglutarate dehydrogenase complex dihydrolipoamide dehydrogenase (E3) component